MKSLLPLLILLTIYQLNAQAPCGMNFTEICLMTRETQVACANAGGNGVDKTISQVLTPGQYFVCGKNSRNLSNASTIWVHAPSIPVPVVASDCEVGVNVRTNLNFSSIPSGSYFIEVIQNEFVKTQGRVALSN